MKVWLVTYFVQDSACEIIGVYDSQEKADEKAKENISYEVVEYEVQ